MKGTQIQSWIEAFHMRLFAICISCQCYDKNTGSFIQCFMFEKFLLPQHLYIKTKNYLSVLFIINRWYCGITNALIEGRYLYNKDFTKIKQQYVHSLHNIELLYYCIIIVTIKIICNRNATFSRCWLCVTWCSAGSAVSKNEADTEDEFLTVLYDPCLNCYFDPESGKYYELVWWK